LVAIQARDAQGLLRLWRSSPCAQAWDDAGVEPLLAPLKANVTTLENRMIASEGLTLAEALSHCNGAVALAALPAPEGADEPFEWALIVQRDDDERLAAVLRDGGLAGAEGRLEREAALCGGLRYARARVVRDRPAAVPIPAKAISSAAMIPTIPTKGKAKTARTFEQAVKRRVVVERDAWLGPGLAVVASTPGSPIMSILDRVEHPDKAASASLAATLATAGMRRPRVAGQVEAYVNVAALGHWQEEHANLLPLLFRLDLRGMGLDDLQWAAAEADWKDDRVAIQGRMTVSASPRGVGRFARLTGATRADAAQVVPANALFYSTTSLSLEQAWDLALQLIGRAGPALQATVTTQLDGFTQATGLDFRADLLGLLEGNLTRCVLPAADGGRPHSVILARARDKAPVRPALEATLNYGVKNFGAYQLESAPLAGGGRLWILRIGRPDAGYVGRPFFHVALAGKWIVFAPDRDGMDAVLERLGATPTDHPAGESRRAAPVLGDAPAFRAAMRALPPERFCEWLTGLDGLLRVVSGTPWPSFDATAGSAFGLGLLNLDAPGAGKALDRQFGPIAGALTRRPDGVGLVMTLPYAKHAAN
jgi:hypothetical protein